ncbi:HEAT repeat domain-containing protein [Gottfriedia acidiceleris]|uniref:HEAT repeat domain-containing protein n=1 Tax=Gottfriedia acidiceleris TaxID=371036 RepID=UPI00101CE364|nr:HEAT repeat domain-containing protein [Gottfriedia acidiceleris]
MDIKQALSFLKEHQPLPSDEELDEETLRELDETRKYFIENPFLECIPLFLNVFGDGSGFGVYQLIEDVIVQFSNEEVVPHLLKSLQSDHKGVRYWSAQIALSFPDNQLIKPLSLLINEKESDIRYVAYTALGEIQDKLVLSILKSALRNEKEPDNYELLEDIIENYELCN